MQWLVSQLINFAINVFASLASMEGGLIVAVLAGVLWVAGWHRRQRKDGKPGVEPSHLIWGGAIGAIICIAILMGGLIWQGHWPSPVRTSQQPPGPKINTPGIGFPASPNSETVQWNQIFGTTRAVDLVFAVFLDGIGPDSKSVKFKDAFLESGITGEVITMMVAGSDNPLEQTFSISEANPLPPKGFIRVSIPRQSRGL